MERFSFGEAIGAGFRVIARYPLAVPIWAAVYVLFVAVPTIAVLAHVLPAAIASLQDAALNGHGRPDPAQIMALRARTFGWQPALWLLQVAVHTVVMAAVFRAVLEPQNSRWAFLRLGRQELWLGLTYLVLMVMTAIMIVMLFIPIAIASAIIAGVAQHGGPPPTGAAMLLTVIGLAGVGVIVWVLLRLSLALPMSFAQARFMLYESWDLTHGQAFRMFLVYLVLGLGVVLFELAVAAVAGMTFLPALRHAAWAGGVGFEGLMSVIHQELPVLAGVVVVVAILAMAFHAILIAPLAEIYREVTAKAPPAA